MLLKYLILDAFLIQIIVSLLILRDLRPSFGTLSSPTLHRNARCHLVHYLLNLINQWLLSLFLLFLTHFWSTHTRKALHGTQPRLLTFPFITLAPRYFPLSLARLSRDPTHLHLQLLHLIHANTILVLVTHFLHFAQDLLVHHFLFLVCELLFNLHNWRRSWIWVWFSGLVGCRGGSGVVYLPDLKRQILASGLTAAISLLRSLLSLRSRSLRLIRSQFWHWFLFQNNFGRRYLLIWL